MSSFQRRWRSYVFVQWMTMLNYTEILMLTMCAFSSSDRPSSGSGGSWDVAALSKAPGLTPIFFSSSEGECPLELSRSMTGFSIATCMTFGFGRSRRVWEVYQLQHWRKPRRCHPPPISLAFAHLAGHLSMITLVQSSSFDASPHIGR